MRYLFISKLFYLVVALLSTICKCTPLHASDTPASLARPSNTTSSRPLGRGNAAAPQGFFCPPFYGLKAERPPDTYTKGKVHVSTAPLQKRGWEDDDRWLSLQVAAKQKEMKKLSEMLDKFGKSSESGSTSRTGKTYINVPYVHEELHRAATSITELHRSRMQQLYRRLQQLEAIRDNTRWPRDLVLEAAEQVENVVWTLNEIRTELRKHILQHGGGPVGLLHDDVPAEACVSVTWDEEDRLMGEAIDELCQATVPHTQRPGGHTTAQISRMGRERVEELSNKRLAILHANLYAFRDLIVAAAQIQGSDPTFQIEAQVHCEKLQARIREAVAQREAFYNSLNHAPSAYTNEQLLKGKGIHPDYLPSEQIQGDRELPLHDDMMQQGIRQPNTMQLPRRRKRRISDLLRDPATPLALQMSNVELQKRGQDHSAVLSLLMSTYAKEKRHLELLMTAASSTSARTLTAQQRNPLIMSHSRFVHASNLVTGELQAHCEVARAQFQDALASTAQSKAHLSSSSTSSALHQVSTELTLAHATTREFQQRQAVKSAEERITELLLENHKADEKGVLDRYAELMARFGLPSESEAPLHFSITTTTNATPRTERSFTIVPASMASPGPALASNSQSSRPSSGHLR